MTEIMSAAEAEQLTSRIRSQLEDIQRQSDDLAVLKRRAPQLKRNPKGSIYFIQTLYSRSIKIGFARNVESRLKVLQIGCPEELSVIAVLPGTLSDEKFLHKHFADARIRGEWFRETPEIRNYIWRYRK